MYSCKDLYSFKYSFDMTPLTDLLFLLSYGTLNIYYFFSRGSFAKRSLGACSQSKSARVALLQIWPGPFYTHPHPPNRELCGFWLEFTSFRNFVQQVLINKTRMDFLKWKIFQLFKFKEAAGIFTRLTFVQNYLMENWP